MNGARLWGIYKQWDTLQLLKNEIRSAAAKWMELWDMMLSEINQTQREEWEGKRFSNKKKIGQAGMVHQLRQICTDEVNRRNGVRNARQFCMSSSQFVLCIETLTK